MNAPKKVTWIICLVLIVIGILATFGILPFLAKYAVYCLMIGGVLLLLATLLKGL